MILHDDALRWCFEKCFVVMLWKMLCKEKYRRRFSENRALFTFWSDYNEQAYAWFSESEKTDFPVRCFCVFPDVFDLYFDRDLRMWKQGRHVNTGCSSASTVKKPIAWRITALRLLSCRNLKRKHHNNLKTLHNLYLPFFPNPKLLQKIHPYSIFYIRHELLPAKYLL